MDRVGPRRFRADGRALERPAVPAIEVDDLAAVVPGPRNQRERLAVGGEPRAALGQRVAVHEPQASVPIADRECGAARIGASTPYGTNESLAAVRRTVGNL
jgi:hypothetical protein